MANLGSTILQFIEEVNDNSASIVAINKALKNGVGIGGTKITLAELQANIDTYCNENRIIRIAVGQSYNSSIDEFLKIHGPFIVPNKAPEIGGGEYVADAGDIAPMTFVSPYIPAWIGYTVRIKEKIADITRHSTTYGEETDFLATQLSDDICEFYVL